MGVNTILRKLCWHCGYSLGNLVWSRCRGVCPECGRTNRGVVKRYRRLKQLRTSFSTIVLIPLVLLCVNVVCTALYSWLAPAKAGGASEYDVEQWRRANSYFHAAMYAFLACFAYAAVVPALCTVLVAAVVPKGVRSRYVFVWAAWIPLPLVLTAVQPVILFVVDQLFKEPWD